MKLRSTCISFALILVCLKSELFAQQLKSSEETRSPLEIGERWNIFDLMRMCRESAARANALAERRLQEERLLDLLRVPSYNQALLDEAAAFHRHIADMHQRTVRCSECRAHIRRIRALSKKLEDALR